MKEQITMYGYKGEIEQLTKTGFKVTIGNETEIISTPNQSWNDGYEITPREVAFCKMIDLVENRKGEFDH